jgi:hypothetical protein
MNNLQELKASFDLARQELKQAQEVFKKAQQNISDKRDILQMELLQAGTTLVNECRMLASAYQYQSRPIAGIDESKEPKLLFLVTRSDRTYPFEYALSAAHFSEPIKIMAEKIIRHITNFHSTPYPYP